MKRIRGFVGDQPFIVDLAIIILVALQAVLTVLHRMPSPWAPLVDPVKQGAAQALYLAMMGPAAIVAGLAGVVVVFGLTVESARFRDLRVKGGKALARTWLATTLAGFEAVLLLAVATVASISGLLAFSPWAFESAVLILAHGAIRLVWIFSGLIRAATADDAVAVDAANVYPVEKLPFNREAS